MLDCDEGDNVVAVSVTFLSTTVLLSVVEVVDVDESLQEKKARLINVHKNAKKPLNCFMCKVLKDERVG